MRYSVWGLCWSEAVLVVVVEWWSRWWCGGDGGVQVWFSRNHGVNITGWHQGYGSLARNPQAGKQHVRRQPHPCRPPRLRPGNFSSQGQCVHLYCCLKTPTQGQVSLTTLLILASLQVGGRVGGWVCPSLLPPHPNQVLCIPRAWVFLASPPLIGMWSHTSFASKLTTLRTHIRSQSLVMKLYFLLLKTSMTLTNSFVMYVLPNNLLCVFSDKLSCWLLFAIH